MAAAIPEVEVADEAHRGGARRIDRKTNPFHPLAEMLHGAQLGAQGVVEVFRLIGQFGEPFPGCVLELVGVYDVGGGIRVADDQLVGEGILAAGENSFKKTCVIGGRQGGNNFARFEVPDANFGGIRQPGGQFEAGPIRIGLQA